MTSIAHSTSITSTSVTFKVAFPNAIYGIVLSNSPSINHYGHTVNHTKSGFTLQTSRTSSSSATNWNYYSLAIGS